LLISATVIMKCQGVSEYSFQLLLSIDFAKIGSIIKSSEFVRQRRRQSFRL